MPRGTAHVKEWELRHMAKKMDVQTTAHCSLCKWEQFGWLATVSEAYTAHRQQEHPELKPPTRRKRYRPYGQLPGGKMLDDNISGARQQGAAGWAGPE